MTWYTPPAVLRALAIEPAAGTGQFLVTAGHLLVNPPFAVATVDHAPADASPRLDARRPARCPRCPARHHPLRGPRQAHRPPFRALDPCPRRSPLALDPRLAPHPTT